MKINMKLRLQNRATLFALIAIFVALVYQVLGMFGIIPPIEQKEILDAVSLLLELLGGLGIIVDPTTHGISDSENAMEYVMPKKPELPHGYWENKGGEEDGECECD